MLTPVDQTKLREINRDLRNAKRILFWFRIQARMRIIGYAVLRNVVGQYYETMVGFTLFLSFLSGNDNKR